MPHQMQDVTVGVVNTIDAKNRYDVMTSPCDAITMPQVTKTSDVMMMSHVTRHHRLPKFVTSSWRHLTSHYNIVAWSYVGQSRRQCRTMLSAESFQRRGNQCNLLRIKRRWLLPMSHLRRECIRDAVSFYYLKELQKGRVA